MKPAWAMLPALLLPATIASSQNYKVETTKLLEVFGNVKASSCGGGCCEGHDSTACVGVQVRDENDVLIKTAIYDNVSCCNAQCGQRQMCGPFNDHEGPANSCPSNSSRFTAPAGAGTSPAGNLNLCVAPGEVFLVPARQAKLGNVVNNSWTTGSNCSDRDRFEPYPDLDLRTYTSWGGFTDTCPSPRSPDIVCVPSDCTPGEPIDGSHAVPRYAVEIIRPYGNEYLTRWDVPEVMLRWRASSSFRLDTYRVVVYGAAGVLIDRQVACATDECSYVAWFPPEPASYYWWVQPVSPTVTGQQSRAGVFNLSPPQTSCARLGGSCVWPSEPGGEATCAEGEMPIGGSLDCPNTCCGVDCSSDQSHGHAGACGSSDSCGHVFGTTSDPGCEPVGPGDTQSCGELGGDYCSATSSCPGGYVSLGTTRQAGAVECLTCCDQTIGDGYCEPGIEDCGTSPSDCPCWMEGTRCNASGSPGQCVDSCSHPAYHNHSASCGQLDECGHAIGNPEDCLLSCGAMGGDYCSQSPGWCPSGDNLGQSNDCQACCRLDPCADPNTHDHGGSCGSTDSCGHSFGAYDDCGCPDAAPECEPWFDMPPEGGSIPS